MSSGNSFGGQLVRQHDDNERYTFLRISSKERNSGDPYDFVARFGNDIKLDNITEIHLMQASIPNIGNNVSADIGNNVFTYTGSVSGPQQVLFTDAFYTTTQIITRLESEINLAIAPSTISVTQDATTGKITFTITGAETITYANTGLNFTLGFTESIGPIGAVSAQALPTLNGSTLFYIHSTNMSNNNTLLYQNYTGNENLDRIVFGKNGRSLRSIGITLRTNGGRLFTELTDNFEMVLVLKVMYN